MAVRITRPSGPVRIIAPGGDQRAAKLYGHYLAAMPSANPMIGPHVNAGTGITSANRNSGGQCSGNRR